MSILDIRPTNEYWKMKNRMRMEKVKCFICNGSGHILRQKEHTRAEKRQAVIMFKKGKSLREIGRKLGGLAPQTVKLMIVSFQKTK